MAATAPTPISSLGRRRPRRLERMTVLHHDTFLAEAIASAARSEGYTMVNVVSTCGAAYDEIRKTNATLLLACLDLLASNDFDMLHLVIENSPETKVVTLADGASDPHLAVEALALGASGLACRDQGIQSLFRVLDLVRDGETVVPRHLTGSLVGALRNRRTKSHPAVHLSSRQREVLRLVARGATDKDICEELNISLTTVRSHLAAIFERTQTGNRTAAALWANAYLDDVAS